jgi:hypothetical protein
MIARCARCQGTFTTDRFGLQTCPHCGSELLLSDPNPPKPGAAGEPGATPEPAAPPEPAATPEPAAPPAPPPEGAGPPPPSSSGAAPGGWVPPPPGGWPPPPPPPPREPAGPEELPAPFAERKALGFLRAFFSTWKLVALEPQRFFGMVRVDQTVTALLFGVVASTFGNLVAGVYALLSGAATSEAFQPMIEQLPEEQAEFLRFYAESLPTLTVAQVLLTPVLAVIGIYVTAALLHLALLVLRGARRGFDATLTAVAYAAGLNVLNAVPGCGALLAVVWGVVVLVVGLGAIQRCGSGKAFAAVLAPAALACVCVCAAIGISAPFLKALGEAARQGGTTSL